MCQKQISIVLLSQFWNSFFFSFLSRFEHIYIKSSHIEHLKYPPHTHTQVTIFLYNLCCLSSDWPVLYVTSHLLWSLGCLFTVLSRLIVLPFPGFSHKSRTWRLLLFKVSVIMLHSDLEETSAFFQNVVLFPNLLFWHLTEPIHL